MTHDEVMKTLIDAGFNSGWVVRDGKIVLWENSEAVPSKLSDCVELEIVTTDKPKSTKAKTTA
jgi:hypothetical protein